ncbi:MAG: hypothetical protein ACI9FJ_002581, partial [Alteromonadaceae bacterium]
MSDSSTANHPTLAESLIEALAAGKVIPVVGAGVSR